MDSTPTLLVWNFYYRTITLFYYKNTGCTSLSYLVLKLSSKTYTGTAILNVLTTTIQSPTTLVDGAMPASVPDVPTPDAEHVGDPAVFNSDLESGDLSGWSSHS